MSLLSRNLTYSAPRKGHARSFSQESDITESDCGEGLMSTSPPLSNYDNMSDYLSPPLPNIEDLSDCESSSCEDNDSSITQPTRAFFLGVRRSKLLSPRELEEARESANTSSETLIGSGDAMNEIVKPKERQLVPDVDPLEYHGLDSSPLPPKQGSRLYRYLRWNFGSVYRRIFCLSFLGNITALALLSTQSIIANKRFTYQQAGTAVTANILAAIIVRNEHVVNALFWVFGTWSNRLPYWARKLVAKVYSYGGIHSGGAVAGTIWFIVYLVLLTMDFQSQPLSIIRSYIYFFSYGIVFMLVTMLISSHPHVRMVMHNWFEGIHRFMGWSVVLLFWAQTMLLAVDAGQQNNMSFGKALMVSPSFWMLIIITLLVIYPWTRLRLREVTTEVLSEHCIKLNFNYRDVHYGQAIRLTDAPLKETHAFGVVPFPAAPKPITHCSGCTCHHNTNNIPTITMTEKQNGSDSEENLPLMDTKSKSQIHSGATDPLGLLSHAGERGFSVFISNAGDWTRKMIQNPPKKIYTRGTPQFGVMRVAGIFEPCIVMATGSGIAPCLSLFVQKPDHPVRIIWSAPAPEETYGRALIDLVYRTDPRAIIIDTRKTGRPDLVKIAYRVWEQSANDTPADYGLGAAARSASRRSKPIGQCEAVVIISNQKVTKKVVYGLESRGVPAFGAIFDS